MIPDGALKQGRFSYELGSPEEEEDKLASAEAYSHAVCMGHIKKLRRFLENSLSSTDNFNTYFTRIFDCFLTSVGRIKMEETLKKINGGRLIDIYGSAPPSQELIQPMTNALIGMTRQRRLIVPEWSDADECWK